MAAKRKHAADGGGSSPRRAESEVWALLESGEYRAALTALQSPSNFNTAVQWKVVRHPGNGMSLVQWLCHNPVLTRNIASHNPRKLVPWLTPEPVVADDLDTDTPANASASASPPLLLREVEARTAEFMALLRALLAAGVSQHPASDRQRLITRTFWPADATGTAWSPEAAAELDAKFGFVARFDSAEFNASALVGLIAHTGTATGRDSYWSRYTLPAVIALLIENGASAAPPTIAPHMSALHAALRADCIPALNALIELKAVRLDEMREEHSTAASVANPRAPVLWEVRSATMLARCLEIDRECTQRAIVQSWSYAPDATHLQFELAALPEMPSGYWFSYLHYRIAALRPSDGRTKQSAAKVRSWIDAVMELTASAAAAHAIDLKRSPTCTMVVPTVDRISLFTRTRAAATSITSTTATAIVSSPVATAVNASSSAAEDLKRVNAEVLRPGGGGLTPVQFLYWLHRCERERMFPSIESLSYQSVLNVLRSSTVAFMTRVYFQPCIDTLPAVLLSIVAEYAVEFNEQLIHIPI